MHFLRANLNLDRLAARADHGRVNRPVQVLLRRRDVVVEFPGDELPKRVHDAERRVAIGDAADEHARRADVHELVERQVLRLHLPPDAENVFRPAFDPRLDAGGAQRCLQLRLEFLDIGLALGAARFQRRGDAPVFLGLQVAERQILEFPLQLPDAEPIGERGVDLARLDRELALGRGVVALRGAHLLQLLGEAHDDQPHVADDGEQHFAQRFGLPGIEAALRRPVGRKSEMAQLAEVARERRRRGAEAVQGGLAVDEFPVEQRVDQRGDHDVVVGLERGDDLRDLHGGLAHRFGRGGQLESANRGEGLGAGFARRYFA